ncbi:alpha/beta hydrolase fold domain-containing protein [Agromyces archimandritae]|uniref:Alpha/beta hydrolase n=1 Tax=Agromyces archimandritae TaxID=2781962 RepID=A0A975FIZ5_9MICO|nr:alpha/beta hydrolase [Agromyces archimandritae]QTX03360.1 alpha/beta hydrolase [Agromyces archimandritae]
MPSLPAFLLPPVIRLTGRRRRSRSTEATRARMEAMHRTPAPFEPPAGIARDVDVSREDAEGMPVFRLRPRGGGTRGAVAGERRDPASAPVVVYLHGGSFTNEIVPTQWRYAAGLAARTGAEIVVPIYPLAQDGGRAGEVVGRIAALAASIHGVDAARPLVLLGDSAGGTLALAAARVLRDAGGPAAPVVLISPALDLAFDDPEALRLAPRDPWLALPGLHATAERWRGALPLGDPRVSPIHAPLTGLGPILIASGTRDLLNADAHRLAAAAREAGHPLELVEAPGGVHVFPFFPTADGRAARERIDAFVRATR